MEGFVEIKGDQDKGDRQSDDDGSELKAQRQKSSVTGGRSRFMAA